jgi:hypothetical protein
VWSIQLRWPTLLTGSGSAGYYVPYIADDFLSHADDKYYKLKGIAISDPAIGSMALQQSLSLMWTTGRMFSISTRAS